MKTLKLYITGLLLFLTANSFAQVSVDIHYGPPAWAPAAPVTVQYYYLPDLGVYYDVPAQRYIYMNRGTWIRSAVLPGRYRGYDLYQAHPVYLTEYRGNAPYVLYKEHKVKYKGNGKWKRNGHDNGRRGKKK